MKCERIVSRSISCSGRFMLARSKRAPTRVRKWQCRQKLEGGRLNMWKELLEGCERQAPLYGI
jgi:hypothetical protein